LIPHSKGNKVPAESAFIMKLSIVIGVVIG
jgi:hypothetical protein